MHASYQPVVAGFPSARLSVGPQIPLGEENQDLATMVVLPRICELDNAVMPVCTMLDAICS